jgi:hypothetical protein
VNLRKLRLASLALVMLCAGVTASGCSGRRTAGYPPLASVSGQVTLGGRPLPEVNVYVRHARGGRAAAGLTDSRGRFAIRYSEVASGAAVGPSVVSFAPLPGVERSPRELSRTFDVEVKPGKNNFSFELRDPPSQ